MSSLSTLTKQAARACGVDIRRKHNVPELTFLGLTTPPPELILDVGANDGGFLEFAGKWFPSATFHCFEPLQEPRGTLEQKLRTGAVAARAQVWPFALGDCDAVQSFNRHVDHHASSSLLSATEFNRNAYPQSRVSRSEPVQVMRLDSWLAEQKMILPSNTLLKLDVQGYEAHVLRGATAALRTIRLCIAEICVAPLYAGQARFAEIVALLDAAGLEYVGNLDQVHDSAGKPVFLDAVFVRNLYANAQSNPGAAA